MSEFNVDEYFANRSKAFTAPDGSDFIDDKYSELQRTSQDKVRELAERSTISAQRDAANQESWVGKQGLDANSFQGKAVNDAANLYQGTFRVAGSVLSAPFTGVAAANQANLSEADIAALGRHQKGQSTPEDLARINRKVAPIVAPTPGMPRELAQAHANERAQAMADLNPNAPTPLSIWEEMTKAREISRTIVGAADKSSAVNMNAQNSFGADLTNTYNDKSSQIAKGWEDLKAGSKLGGSADVAVGVAKLLFGGISDVAGNPQATFEYMVQNAPQLFVGLAGKAGATAQLVDNVSSAADNYNKGIQGYQAKNGGALPPEGQRQHMAFMAATHAAAEMVGDKIGLAATKLGGEAAQDVTRASFKSALKGTSAAVAEGVVSEAPTEAWQQFAEGEITGKPATGAEIFAAAVIGGASGAGLSGGGRGVHEAAKLLAQPSEAKQKTIDRAKVQEAAIESGDVSTLTDPVEKIAALVGHSQKGDTTQEQKQTNLDKAGEVITDLETQYENAQQEVKMTTVDGTKEILAARQAMLEDPAYANDPEMVGAINQSIKVLQEGLAELEAGKGDAKAGEIAQKKLDGISQQLKEANLAKDNLTLLVHSKEAIEADLALISTPAPKEEVDALAADVAPRATAAVGVSHSEKQAAAADRIITLAMTAPGRLDSARLTALAEDTTNALTAPQRNYLRAFTQAETVLTAAKGMEGVRQDIFKGSPEDGKTKEFIGIDQYRKRMAAAAMSGNTAVADGLLETLGRFTVDHEAKATVARQALNSGIGTQILRTKNVNGNLGEWYVNKGEALKEDALRTNAGLAVKSGRLVNNMETETNALKAAHTELLAIYDLKFNNATKGATNVQNVSQQGSGTQNQVENTSTTKPTEESVGASNVVTSGSGTDVSVTGAVGTASVEANGVTTTPTHADVVGTSSNPANFPIDLTRVGEIQTSKTGEKSILGMTQNSQVRLVDGAEIPVNVGAGVITSKDGIIDVGIVTAFKNDVAGTKWIAVKGITPLNTTSTAPAKDTGVSTVPIPKEVVKGIQAALRGEPLPNGLEFSYKNSNIRVISPDEITVLPVREQQRARLANEATVNLLNHLTSPRALEFAPWAKKMGLDPSSAEARNRYVSEGRLDLQPPEIDLNGGFMRVGPSTAAPQISSTEKTVTTEEPLGSSVNAKSTQSTEKTEKTTEEVKSTTEVTDQSKKEDAAKPAGTLEALATKSPEGTPFKSRNLVADHFTQSAGKESDTTHRPLVTVKNFLSQMTSKTVLDSLSFSELTDAQFNLLKTFKSTAVSWQSTIQNNLVRKKNKEFFYEDLMQFLMQDTDKGVALEENVQTAMSYAAFSWVAENASRSRFNTPAEINLILGRDEDHTVSNREIAVLGDVGTRQNVVANALGQRAVQALGLSVSKEAPKDLGAKLEGALGAHIFKMLMDQGIMERVTVPGSVMATLTGNESTDTNAGFQFLRVGRTSDNKLNDAAAKITEAVRGTQGVLDKLFSVEAGLKEPSLEPIPFQQTKTKNTNQGVPSKLAAVIERENAVPSYVRQDMWQLVNQIDTDTMLEIAGAEHLEGKHVSNIPSLEATNDGLARELDRFKAFVGGMVDQTAAMYFEHTVWKQQRVGIATNAVNPQTSKIHRHMLFRQSWETKIDRNDATQLENFQLRVAEGLGIKTDKQGNTKSLDKYQEKVAEPAIQAAVTVLVQMLQGEDMSPAKEKILIAGVKAGGEKMHSLDALMALAQEQYTKGDTFTTHLMGEVDGVTNGPMLSHLLMGAANSVAYLFKLLNRGGFYELGNEHNQYNLWREAAGHFDLYENTALHMTQAVQSFINDGVVSAKGKTLMSGKQVNAVVQSIYAFTGSLELKGVVQKAGRNIIKTPLTAMVFGSSVGSAVESMADKFVESIYAGIEDLAAGKGDRSEVIAHINTLIGQSRNAYSIPANMTVEQLMAHEFSTAQIDGMKRAFKNTIGKAVSGTMQSDFESFISQRQQFNHAAQMTFELYNAAYTGLRDQMIDDLIASGELAVNGKGQAIHDLTAQQEAQLRKRLSGITPIMHTLMSKDSGQLNAGLYISKSGKSLSSKSSYEGSVQFGTKFSDNGAASTKTRGFETVETAPGVAMAPMSVHSTDSAIMHNSITDELNVHDAKGVGVAGFQQAAQTLNQSTWDAMLRYSPAGEMFSALSRTVVGLSELLQNGDLPASVTKNLATVLEQFADDKDMDPATVLHDMVEGTRNMATHADNIKLQALERMQAIDQYALQGGNYTVTEKDRAEAAARRAELPTALSKQESEAISQIESILKDERVEGLTKQAKDIEEDVLTPSSPFGKLGQSTKGDPALVAFFKENPKATAKQVIKFLYDKLTADTGAVNRDFNLKLLKVLLKTVPVGLTVNLVTKDTQASDVAGKPDEPALGWYTHRGAEEVIYIVGTDFTHSNMQVEVLLHELTHAATSYRLFATAGKAQLAELTSLLEQVRKHAKDNGITKFDAALINVDELVAYGMTSPAFQKLLAQVSVEQTTNKVSDALQKFVGILAGLLGFKQTSDAKALGVLITNVAVLMEQSATERTELDSRTLSMAATTNDYNTLDIHEALADGSLTNEFDEHLRGLLGGIVDKLHGPFGAFKESLVKNQTGDAVDAWLNIWQTGEAPFASESMANIATSPQVAHVLEQVEATVRAALGTNESQTKMVYREMYKLYGEAETLLSPEVLHNALPGGDWNTATPTEKATAQALYDYLFKLEQNNGDRSDYLARFAALGLAHPQINKALQIATAVESRKVASAKTLLQRLEAFFENVLRLFQGMVTHTYQGQPADAKLESLVTQLIGIEAKRLKAINDRASKSNFLEPVEAKIKQFTDAAGAKIVAVAGSKYIRNHKNTYVKVGGALVGTVASGRADLFMENLFKLRSETFKKRFGVVASLMQAYTGQSIVFQGLLRMTKLLEGDRQDQVASWAKSSLEAFVDNGKGLRGKAEAAVASRSSITSIFLRTGAHNLMGDFDMQDILQLISDKPTLDAAIKSFEDKLTGFGNAAAYYRNQANALGFQKATGIARRKFVNQNAYLIARLAGTGQEARISANQAEQAEATLKVLTSLYALRYSGSIPLKYAADVLRAENQRSDGMNGVKYTLDLHKLLEVESLDRLFGGNPALMVHGYTSEIYDPNVDVQTANELEGLELIHQGYRKGARVSIDPADADQDVKHLYVLEDGGLPRFVSGVISNRGMKAKGTTIHNGYLNTFNQTGIANASQNAAMMQDRRSAIADMFRAGPVADLSKEKGNYMVPVFNEAGDVVNWRYMMSEATKDQILRRNNRFDKVLGTVAGSIYDKETSREQNMTAVKALHEQYKTDYKNNPKMYMDVSPKSADPEMQEIWKLLPENTRKDILSVWGYKGMMVRVDNLDIMFGYHKLSVGTVFKKANEERDARKAAGERDNVMALKTIDAWQKLIVMTFEFPLIGSGLKQGLTMEEAKKYARRAGSNAVRTEHIWQALVSEAKDIIVVKSGIVMLGNIKSNMWLLAMSGVPLLDVMHHHIVAWKGAVSWKQDTEELEHLKRLRSTGYTQGKKADIDRRILRLEDSLDRNPVKELVEAGLMPTIVEDVNPEDDLYSYKSQLVRKVETFTDKLNPTLVKAARTAYLAHDTKIYQTMSQITKLSDFMARYTMYQHLITKKNPLSKQEATQKVSEAFINYDIALHRNIQYTDDMGITMFTKYFIGIQKVLMDTLRENPARVLTGALLSKFLGLGPTVLDGSMWNHIGNNPLRSGPFELLDALSELPMVNAPLAMFNMNSSPAP